MHTTSSRIRDFPIFNPIMLLLVVDSLAAWLVSSAALRLVSLLLVSLQLYSIASVYVCALGLGASPSMFPFTVWTRYKKLKTRVEISQRRSRAIYIYVLESQEATTTAKSRMPVLRISKVRCSNYNVLLARNIYIYTYALQHELQINPVLTPWRLPISLKTHILPNKAHSR